MCPYQFQLKYILEEPGEAPAEITSKGLKLHELFDRFYDCSFSMEEAAEKVGVDKEFLEKYRMHIWSFYDFNNRIMYEKDEGIPSAESTIPLAREVKIEHKNWKGVLDRVDDINGKIVITDYKTTTGNNLSFVRDELILYADLWQYATDINTDEIGVLFTGNNNNPREAISQEHIRIMMTRLENEIINIQDEISTGVFEKKPGRVCSFCPYSKKCRGNG
jgi:hypothetical protein